MLPTPWKTEKTLSLIKHLTAEFMMKQYGGPALLTVTDTTISEDRKHATIYVSVLPEIHEKEAMEFLKQNLKDLREYIIKHSRMRVVPFLETEIDTGEKNRRKIDELLKQANQ